MYIINRCRADLVQYKFNISRQNLFDFFNKKFLFLSVFKLKQFTFQQVSFFFKINYETQHLKTHTYEIIGPFLYFQRISKYYERGIRKLIDIRRQRETFKDSILRENNY